MLWQSQQGQTWVISHLMILTCVLLYGNMQPIHCNASVIPLYCAMVKDFFFQHALLVRDSSFDTFNFLKNPPIGQILVYMYENHSWHMQSIPCIPSCSTVSLKWIKESCCTSTTTWQTMESALCGFLLCIFTLFCSVLFCSLIFFSFLPCSYPDLDPYSHPHSHPNAKVLAI